MIVLVAAASENNALGKNNDLPWHLPADFKRFKSITAGHSIIMGRKTFESLPGILPNRRHIVITRQQGYHPEGCIIVDSLNNAIKLVPETEDAFIIGGGEIFKMSMAIADKIELTRVHAEIEGDTFFPEIDPKTWQLDFEEFHPKDERHIYDFTFQTFSRRDSDHSIN
ncbi:MAG TPA: dihydrofolate reductase [Flavobacterium sp.]